jgi:hypothetical protein
MREPADTLKEFLKEIFADQTFENRQHVGDGAADYVIRTMRSQGMEIEAREIDIARSGGDESAYQIIDADGYVSDELLLLPKDDY